MRTQAELAETRADVDRVLRHVRTLHEWAVIVQRKILRPTDACACASAPPWCDAPMEMADVGMGWLSLVCPNPDCRKVWSP